MNDALTRAELLRRAALGGVAISLPGFLAACGGGGDGDAAGTTTAGSQELADTLRFSNWQLYIDVDPKTKKSPSLQQFTAKTGVKVDYVEDINDNASYFGKIQGPLSQGRGIDRDIIVMTDNSRFPALLIQKEWVQKLDKARIPNIANLIPAQGSPPFDPDRSYSLPWASGITGIATNVKASGGDVIDDDRPTARGSEAQGQGHAAHRDGGHDEHGHARQRRRPGEGHRRELQQGPRPDPDRRSTRVRSAASRATTTSATWRRATSPPRPPGRATSPRVSRPTRTSAGTSPRPEATSGPTTCSFRPAATRRRRRST